MKGRTLVLSIALLAGTVFPAQAMAQSDSNQKVEELQKQLDELRKQRSKLEAQLGELRSKATEAAAPTAAPPAAQEGTIQATLPPAQAAPSKQVGEATATYTTFSEDSVAAARFNNVPLDPKYHGFFRLPGTETLLKIGGYFKTDFIYDLKPAGNTDAFVPSSIPIPTVVGVNNTTVSIRPTRLSLDFRVPTTNIGDVRFYVEGDLFGTNATTPRLRHAYAQARNVLIGQTFSNFMDPDGFPDTLDFQGPNGMVSVRNPQLRYGLALTPSTTLYISVEKPSSDVIFKTPQFSDQPNAPGPDGAIRLRQEFERGHFQVAAVFRSIAAFVPTTPTPKTDSVFGWGVNVSTGLESFGKDEVIFALAFGHGISRYLQDTSGLRILVLRQSPVRRCPGDTERFRARRPGQRLLRPCRMSLAQWRHSLPIQKQNPFSASVWLEQKQRWNEILRRPGNVPVRIPDATGSRHPGQGHWAGLRIAES